MIRRDWTGKKSEQETSKGGVADDGGLAQHPGTLTQQTQPPLAMDLVTGLQGTC